jgi:uncharacterized protein YfaQ (DUF2300 family)
VVNSQQLTLSHKRDKAVYCCCLNSAGKTETMETVSIQSCWLGYQIDRFHGVQSAMERSQVFCPHATLEEDKVRR